jgi:aminoglycoside phosphotransferase (APT) family kinase protein
VFNRLPGGLVPVPAVIHAEPYGLEDLPPFTLARYVEGISLRDLRRRGDAGAIAEAAYSAGETLAAIGRATFARPGWIAPGPAVTAPLLEGKDPTPRFVDLCLGSIHLERRMAADLRDRGTGRTHSRNCRRPRPGSDMTQPRAALLSYIG